MKTTKQKQQFIRYCLKQKMSLSRIGSLLGMTRQAVWELSKGFRKGVEEDLEAADKIKLEAYIKKHEQRENY